MAREDLHFRLRIPEELKVRVEASAEVNNRSMTAEIVSRLAESLDNDARLRLANASIQDLRGRLAYQEGLNASFRQTNQIYLKYLVKAVNGEAISLEEIRNEINNMQPENPYENKNVDTQTRMDDTKG